MGGSLPADCRVIFSDQSQQDDTIERLVAGWGGDPRMRFRTAAGPPGWRQHCNALLAAVETPLAAILPQDDSMGQTVSTVCRKWGKLGK